MRLVVLSVVSAVVTACAPAGRAAEVTSADSMRGAEVFRSQDCVECHALNGVGPKIGPDLGGIADRGFTPDSLAATIWNHAPRMWSEMQRRGVRPPAMNEQDAADLFAFFYSLRYFEEPGDAGRGKALFAEKKCAVCHGINQPLIPNAKPVSDWTVASDPLTFVETMWDHSSAMRAEMKRRNIQLPHLTGQEMADILVYTRHAAGGQPKIGTFESSSVNEGRSLFESKGCADCHGMISRFLAIGLKGETLTDIAAGMWNHGLDMNLDHTTFEPGQMRAIVNYIWFARSIEGEGEVGRGAKVFEAKKCGICHDNPSSGAPALAPASAGKRYSAVSMVSALTLHGPQMLERMRQQHFAWPHFSSGDMSALIAYLNTRTAPNGK